MNHLHNDEWRYLFLKLNTKDIVMLREVCKFFSRLVNRNHKRLWTSLIVRDMEYPSKGHHKQAKKRMRLFKNDPYEYYVRRYSNMKEKQREREEEKNVLNYIYSNGDYRTYTRAGGCDLTYRHNGWYWDIYVCKVDCRCRHHCFICPYTNLHVNARKAQKIYTYPKNEVIQPKKESFIIDRPDYSKQTSRHKRKEIQKRKTCKTRKTRKQHK